MSSGYFPPGHPTGIISSRWSAPCPLCGKPYRVRGSFDRSVNALDLDENDDFRCPCGGDLSEVYSWDEDPEPEVEAEPCEACGGSGEGASVQDALTSQEASLSCQNCGGTGTKS